MTAEQREREQFNHDMRAHVAQLMGFAHPFVARLSKKERTYLLSSALDFAWQWRKDFNPKKASLLLWWGECLRAAALTQRTWQEFHMDRWVKVSGSRLGAQE